MSGSGRRLQQCRVTYRQIGNSPTLADPFGRKPQIDDVRVDTDADWTTESS